MNPETNQIDASTAAPALQIGQGNPEIALSAAPPELREPMPASPVPWRSDLAMIKPGQYCHVSAWQRVAVTRALHDALGVTAGTVDDALYALIWAFTSEGDGYSYASSAKLGSMVGASARRVRTSISNMLRAGLIVELPATYATRIKRLAAVTDHPAVLAAKRWDAGEDDRPAQGSADDARAKLAALKARVEVALDAYTDEQLEQLDIAALVASVVGQVDGPEGAQEAPGGPAAADRPQQPVRQQKRPQTRPEGPQAGRSAPDLIDLAAAPDGYRELAELASEHNGNKTRWRESLAAYEALVVEGYAPDEICDGYRALAGDLAADGVPDGKWPNILAYLTSTASCAGAKGARRRMDAARERAAREAAAAAAADEERAAQEREAAEAAAYEATLAELVAASAEYADLEAEMMALIPRIKLDAAPGDPAYEAKLRLDEVASRHDALLGEIKAEARRRCGLG